MPSMIEVQGISKHFGPIKAVDDLSFRCEPGTVTGFLGPNGAGKSTTLRMICGLARPTAGAASVLGLPYSGIANPGRHVGIMLDASAQHSGRSGRETLKISAGTIGVDDARISEVLGLVGLDEVAAKRRVGKYSLGMRQRLGLAHTLLGDPSVLILDEPANGLDPQGIIWMRELLRGFADGGGTVLLSSHLLHEIDAIADQIVLINKGKLVAKGSREELLTSSGSYVRAAEDEALGQALTSAGIETHPAQGGGFIAAADGPAVGSAALAAGVALSELRAADGGGLEGLFLSLTSEGAGDAPETPAAADPAAEASR